MDTTCTRPPPPLWAAILVISEFFLSSTFCAVSPRNSVDFVGNRNRRFVPLSLWRRSARQTRQRVKPCKIHQCPYALPPPPPPPLRPTTKCLRRTLKSSHPFPQRISNNLVVQYACIRNNVTCFPPAPPPTLPPTPRVLNAPPSK